MAGTVSVGDVVALPEAGDGSRRRRRRRRGRPARLRRWSVLVLLAAAVVGTVVWQRPQATGGHGSSSPTSTSALVTAPPRVDLLVQRGAGGAVVELALVVVTGSRQGGTVVRVPVRTMVDVPALGLIPLDDAARNGGVAAVRQAVENVLGRPLDGVGELADAQVPALATAVGASAGDWQRAWETWLGSRPAAGLPIDADLQLLAAGTVEYRLLPVDAVGGEPPLFKVRAADLDALVAELLPGTPTGSKRIRVQVLNGSGKVGVSDSVEPLLVAVGARVTLTTNADRFDYETTRVVYYDEGDAAAAQKVRDALGIGTLERSTIVLDTVDVTVVVGRDFATRLTGSTTTTTKGA